MDKINKLSHLFSSFPGIGPRQSKRFVYFLLTRNPEFLEEMVNLISSLKREIKSCEECFRFFQDNYSKSAICDICSDKNRDSTKLMIICRDVDLEMVEKSGSFNGIYFILGGYVPILDKNQEDQIRLKQLTSFLEKKAEAGNKHQLKEIVLGMNANPAGEYTSDFIKKALASFLEKYSIKISILGRGLSTGTELEYSDADTIKNALRNRA